jgi:hypothetical protein
VYKILQGHDNVRAGQWFKIAVDRGHITRQATGMLNLIKPRASPEITANFFS